MRQAIQVTKKKTPHRHIGMNGKLDVFITFVCVRIWQRRWMYTFMNWDLSFAKYTYISFSLPLFLPYTPTKSNLTHSLEFIELWTIESDVCSIQSLCMCVCVRARMKICSNSWTAYTYLLINEADGLTWALLISLLRTTAATVRNSNNNNQK